MSWHKYHSQSEKLASDAEMSVKQGDADRASGLYRLAAEAEVCALKEIDPDKVRTIGIIAVSAAALYYKAGDYQRAKDIAERWLNNSNIPPFAADQLGDILQALRDDRSRKDVGKGIDEPLFTSAGEGTPKSNFSASVDDLSLYKLHSLMSQLIKKENELLDELQRAPFKASNNRKLISVAIPLLSILLLFAGGLYFYNQIRQAEQDKRLESLRFQVTVQIMPHLIQSGKYDKESALQWLDDLLDPATLQEIAPILKGGNTIEAIAKLTTSDNQKVKNAALEIFPVIVNDKGTIYSGTINEAITVEIEWQKQPSKLSATLNGKELSVNGNTLTFSLESDKKQPNLLQLTFQGNLGDMYKVKILGNSSATIKYLIKQNQIEVPGIFLFTTV